MSDQPTPLPPQPSTALKRVLIVAIFLIVIAVAGFYIMFPFLGIVVAMTATMWTIVVATILFFCIAVLLFFIIPGMIVFLISIAAFIWTVFAIAVFPLLFPIILPVFIILLVIAFIRRRRK